MKILLRHFVIGIFIICALGSCTIEKRVYLHGYSLKWLSGTSQIKKHKAGLEDKSSSINNQRLSKVKINADELSFSEVSLVKNDVLMDASNARAKSGLAFIHRKILVTTVETGPCDTIILSNGKKIHGKVISNDPNYVTLTNCSNTGGSSNNIPKSSINEIHFGNGTIEVVNPKSPEKVNVAGKPYQENTRGQVLGGFVVSLVGMLFEFGIIFFGPISFLLSVIMGIAGIIISANGLGNIKKEKLDKGKGMAIAGIVIGIFDIVSILLIILSAI